MPVHGVHHDQDLCRRLVIAVAPKRAVGAIAARLRPVSAFGIRLEEAAPPDVSGGALGSRLNRRWPCGLGTR